MHFQPIIFNYMNLSCTPEFGTIQIFLGLQYLVCITTYAGRPMDHCVSSVYNFITENNHSPIYNKVADQHNMFIMRPWNEAPQMVEIVQLGASSSLPIVFFSSLLWLTPASPKHLSLLKLMTTSIYANRMATQLAWHTGEQV